MTDSQAAATLAIVVGRPTARETAAVVVVLSARLAQARAARAQAGSGTQNSRWAAPSRMLGAQVAAGPGAWRASALPR